MLRASFIVTLILLMLLTGACGFGGSEPVQTSLPPDQDQVAEGETSGVVEEELPEILPLTLPPINQVNEVAAVFYEGVFEGENISGFVEAIYEALGIPVLNPETELDQIERAVENQTPFALESQMELIANALASGMHINLESFIKEINQLGFYAVDPRGEITKDYLSQNLSYLMDQTEFSAEENQVALILNLGRTRSSILYGELSDPVWGDDLLDPLQSALLWNLLDRVAAAPQASTSQTIQRISYSSGTGNPQRGGPIAEFIGALGNLGNTLNEYCKTAKIFGHKSTLSLSESQIYRQTPGSKRPSASEATFSLEFSFKPATAADNLPVKLNCPDLPSIGPRPDIPVTWELIPSGTRGASLESLGVFTPGGPTNNQGISEANYLANLEPVPIYLQQDENADAAAGLIRATAADLYPGDKQVLTVLTQNADKKAAEGVYRSLSDLWVWYYTFPTVEWFFLDERTGLTMEGKSSSCDGVNWVGTHEYSHNLAGFSVTTSAEFEFTVPEIQLGDSIMSDPIEVVFGGVYETSDGPIPVSDRRQVWLEISEAEVTMNFEPLGATVTIDGQTVPFPGAFVFRSIPANLMSNNSCD